MLDLTVHPTTRHSEPIDPEVEIERLESLLTDQRAELSKLQKRARAFKTRYAAVVGRRLAELAEVERKIRAAERRAFEVDEEPVNDEGLDDGPEAGSPPPVRKALRRLFWSVARMFHPDLAEDEHDAKRRHSVMAEANRAYRDGDLESLNLLLGDDQFQLICATTARHAPEDHKRRIFDLEDELRTVEFGIKRLKMDSLFKLMLSVEEEELIGRDPLTTMARAVDRQIAKARNRLEHFL